jgi:S-DNA-T family DNA segregation ATPase FtsK/SpoIIIE
MKKTGYPLAYDIGGVILIATAAILQLALLSYSPLDNAVQPHGQVAIQNWIGPGGSLLAYAALTLFGLLAWGLPALLVLSGVSVLWRGAFWHSPMRWIGGVLVTLSLGALLESAEVLRSFFSFMPGGLLGHLVMDTVSKYFSTIGTVIWAACFLAVGLILLTGAGLLENIANSKAFPARLRDGVRDAYNWCRAKVRRQPESPNEAHEVEVGTLEVEAPFRLFSEELAPSVVVLSPEEPAPLHELLSQIPRPSKKTFALPPLKLLDYDAVAPVKIDEGQLRLQADRLEKTFEEFSIKGHVREIRPGPVVTLFEGLSWHGLLRWLMTSPWQWLRCMCALWLQSRERARSGLRFRTNVARRSI